MNRSSATIRAKGACCKTMPWRKRPDAGFQRRGACVARSWKSRKGRSVSSVALAPAAASRFAVNPWLVAGAVFVPTFMEVLDTTIANVALRYIAGGLSAAVADSEWVITSYLAANAVVLPISGWLSARLGRRNYFLGSIV